MPKVTEGFIRREFYKSFKRIPHYRREGIIEALTTIHECVDDAEEQVGTETQILLPEMAETLSDVEVEQGR